MDSNLIVALAVVAVAIIILLKTAVVVPQQNAFVIERLGKYSKTLNAGFHILIPFLERIAYKHTLKEQAVDIAEQICITKDNVQVGVDGVLYMQVLDPGRASYGIGNYMFAISQLAQTTSTRVMPCEESVFVRTASPASGSQKLGQPEPESYLCSELNSGASQQTHR